MSPSSMESAVTLEAEGYLSDSIALLIRLRERFCGAALPAAAISSMEPESNTFSNLKKNRYP